MPWYAQRQGAHPHYADEGSQLATVYQHIGYVEVSAPEPAEPVAAPEPDRDDFGDPLPAFDPVSGVEGGDALDEDT